MGKTHKDHASDDNQDVVVMMMMVVSTETFLNKRWGKHTMIMLLMITRIYLWLPIFHIVNILLIQLLNVYN